MEWLFAGHREPAYNYVSDTEMLDNELFSRSQIMRVSYVYLMRYTINEMQSRTFQVQKLDGEKVKMLDFTSKQRGFESSSPMCSIPGSKKKEKEINFDQSEGIKPCSITPPCGPPKFWQTLWVLVKFWPEFKNFRNKMSH